MSKLLSTHILKQTIKENWKLWLILTAALSIMIFVISVVGGELGADTPAILGGGVIGLFANIFFVMPGMILMLLYVLGTGNKLIAHEVDRGTICFTLNTPTTRLQLLWSKGNVYVASIFLMAAIVGLAGTLASLILDNGLNLTHFWQMVLGYGLLGFAIGGISFCASCWFNKSSISLMLGAGIPVGFLVVNILASIPDLDFLRFFTINALFDTYAIITNGTFIPQFVAMFVIGMALYAIGTVKFLRKDLPI